MSRRHITSLKGQRFLPLAPGAREITQPTTKMPVQSEELPKSALSDYEREAIQSAHRMRDEIAADLLKKVGNPLNGMAFEKFEEKLNRYASDLKSLAITNFRVMHREASVEILRTLQNIYSDALKCAEEKRVVGDIFFVPLFNLAEKGLKDGRPTLEMFEGASRQLNPAAAEPPSDPKAYIAAAARQLNINDPRAIMSLGHIAEAIPEMLDRYDIIAKSPNPTHVFARSSARGYYANIQHKKRQKTKDPLSDWYISCNNFRQEIRNAAGNPPPDHAGLLVEAVNALDPGVTNLFAREHRVPLELVRDRFATMWVTAYPHLEPERTALEQTVGRLLENFAILRGTEYLPEKTIVKKPSQRASRAGRQNENGTKSQASFFPQP